MSNPYDALGTTAFWRTAVAEKGPLGLEHLWAPKFQVRPEHKIVTAGSCFAQHIGKALAERGYSWLDAEPAPPWVVGGGRRHSTTGFLAVAQGISTRLGCCCNG